MIDWVRCRETDAATKVERVERILYDPNRSARIALVAEGETKRYVIATQNMKAGDLINSTQLMTRSPGESKVHAGESEAHLIGQKQIR